MTETTAQDPAAAAVRLDVREHVAWITINRPPLNVLDVATNRALSTTVRSLSKRSDVRVVALTGAGIRRFPRESTSPITRVTASDRCSTRSTACSARRTSF